MYFCLYLEIKKPETKEERENSQEKVIVLFMLCYIKTYMHMN